jgi:hypothetical protein
MAFIIKQHDLRPRYRVKLTQTDPSNPTATIPVDLTDATSVRFLMSTASGTTAKVDAPAAFVDRTGGIVEYAWQAGDTDTVGDYSIEFEVMWGTEPQTFPSNGYFTARINADLG